MAHSYVDGIKVKISEKYKPPFRISKSQQQHLMLNQKLQEDLPCYDFALEKKCLENVSNIKEQRRIMLEERKQRLIQKREEHKLKIEQEMAEKTEENQVDPKLVYADTHTRSVYKESTAPNVPPLSHNQTISSQNQPNYITKNGILMPIPASYARNILNPLQTYEHQQLNNVKPFNLSDFESDTSSPFDNMELKSINDLEELAQVLKSNQSNFSSSTCNTYPSPLQFNNSECFHSPSSKNVSSSQLPQNSLSYNKMTNSYNLPSSQFNQIPASFSHYSYLPTSDNYPPYNANVLNGYLFNNISQATSQTQASGSSHLSELQNNSPNHQHHLLSMRKTQCKSVPDLAKELENTHLDDIHVKTKVPMPVRPKSTDSGYPKGSVKDGTLDLLETLSNEEREICQNVSLMGFPLDRVVRICKIIGCDQKKVVDHLLALSELLDLGFSEKPASEALLINDNDRDKALDLLIS